jgi:polysaccharide chain length determinant protein (PEP-CTERM system associated)
MEELFSQLNSLARGMWKFRWPGIAVAWIVGALAVAAVFRIPDQYEATARIFVDTQSILKPLMSGLAVQPNVEQQVTMLSRTLISRPNIEKLIRMADLDLKSESKAQQEALIESLTRTLEIKSTARDNLYSLTFRDTEPEKAKRVVQSLVSIFVESSLGASRKDTDQAKVFLDEQIKTYETKLQEAEARLKEFRLRNIELQGVDGKDAASRVGEIVAQLEQARLQLREAEQARDAAKAQLAAERARGADLSMQSLLQESAASLATPEIDARLDAQKRSLDALLQRYTELHPDVVNTRRLIRELEDQKRKEVAALRKAAMAAPMPTAPVASLADQELNRLLATSEVQVASLRARVAEFSARYAQARSQMQTTPKIEAEAARLDRDYNINKKNYESLVGRRQSAAMSGDLDLASGVADFRLIDPPRASPRPVSPNRLLLLPLALAAALASGLFVSFAATQLRPVFHTAAELREKTQLPLLGVVSMLITEADRRRDRNDLVRFIAASGGLVGVFVLGIAAMWLLAAR